MTLDEINKSIKNAILKLGNRSLQNNNDFDSRTEKFQLKELIKDLKRRKRELNEAN